LSLINDVLDMSKIEAGKREFQFEKLNLDELVSQCFELTREIAVAGNVKLLSGLPASPVFLYADRMAARQILLNLLSNAIKFTTSGGHITVKARETSDSIVLSVQDDGCGIPADQIPVLGRPFVQVRNSTHTTQLGASQSGTGLGLALVRSLAEQHGGSFGIESAIGVGTTVRVSLPKKQSADKADSRLEAA
jgi:two-component system, cell cycle sensor histidine kinase PleC